MYPKWWLGRPGPLAPGDGTLAGAGPRPCAVPAGRPRRGRAGGGNPPLGVRARIWISGGNGSSGVGAPPPVMTVDVVLVRQESAPGGGEPIEWRLLTSLPVRRSGPACLLVE